MLWIYVDIHIYASMHTEQTHSDYSDKITCFPFRFGKSNTRHV